MWFLNNKKKESKAKAKRENIAVSPGNKNILKSIFELPVQEAWLDDDTIEKILRDGTVESSIGSRKAATLKKEIIITCKDDQMRKELENIFNYDILDCILDTPYYGFNAFEINWENKSNILYPILEDRDYKDFVLDGKQLCYFPNGILQEIPLYKSVYVTYRAKAKRPYGKPILNTLFWLIEFKNASLEFWVELLEKFGTPWVIGKTEGNKDDFADEIFNMLGGDGAVIDNEDSIEIVTAKDKGNYKELIEYIDDQIRQLILGGNLTSNVKGGSQAAATVHNDIREDLAKADENIVNKVIKEVLNNFKEINTITEEIIGEFKDKDDPNTELANRDKVISDMGYKPTQEYIEQKYNIKVEKIEPTKQIVANSKLMHFSKHTPEDEIEYQTNKVDTKKPLTFQTQILKIIENSKSYEDMQDKLSGINTNINIEDLQEMLFNNIANAEILGRTEIENENGNS
jgi:phage gp29-like protein